MKNKPTITYIKNGVEKTINLNFWNYSKIFQYHYDCIPESNLYYQIRDDIEFIHIKNMVFNNPKKIELPNDSICILEDCTFNNEYLTNNTLYIRGSHLELINPKLIGIKKLDISSCNDVDIKYTKELEEKLFEIDSANYLRLAEQQRTIDITDQNNIEEITTRAISNISLKDKFKLKKLTLLGTNISLGNLKESSSLIITKEISPYIKAHQKLNLKDLVLINRGKGEVNIDSPQINVENVTLTSKTSIQINKNNYHKKTADGYVIVTDRDIARTNLINALKTIQVSLKKQIKLEETKRLKEYNQEESKEKLNEQRRIVEEKKKELEKEEATLAYLTQEIKEKKKEKGQKINKSLSRKKVKYFTENK